MEQLHLVFMLKILLFFCLLQVYHLSLGHKLKYSYHLWPHPAKVHMTYDLLSIDPHSIQFLIAPSSNCDVIHQAIVRQRDRMFTQDCSKLDLRYRGQLFRRGYKINFKSDKRFRQHYRGKLSTVVIDFTGKCELYPQFGMDESYKIVVTSEPQPRAEISSRSVWGVLRGLETFSQLVDNVGEDQFTINLVEIRDAPRFPYRGLMVDTSRHFLSMKSLLQTLDIMEMNKYNVLHWHIVDDQSFPYNSTHFPKLSSMGAYTRNHMYTVQDIRLVLNYARLRGIRVLVEFDTPGHVESWGRAQPGLLTKCYTGNSPNGRLGPIDPSRRENFEFLREFFGEIATLFPDRYLHLGGDEVNTQCWASNPRIQRFLAQKKLKVGNLQQLYTNKLVRIAEQLNKSAIVWQDVFDEGVHLRPDTVVQVWIEYRNGGWRREMSKVTKAGYRAILSAPWYLEGVRTEGWRKYYETEPLDFDGSPVQKRLVQGGEGCMWGEYVDGGNLVNKMWPTSSALAEKLWSPPNFNKAHEGLYRFQLQHCRLQTLGVRLGPMAGPGFCLCDFAV